jgi:uncharacterized protein (DUF488 family)
MNGSETRKFFSTRRCRGKKGTVPGSLLAGGTTGLGWKGMADVTVYTAGFAKKSAEEFFGKLKKAGVKTVLDVRLNNVSQFAGFSKRNDFAYFLRELCGCGYRHEPLLAPTREILDAYRKREIDWAEYESRFNTLLREREVEKLFELGALDRTCLLCSEPEPGKCHRRLVAEYLQAGLGGIEIRHL